MATKNRRVATYLPPDVDEKFKEYKEQKSIDGDSEALINILRDYLGVTHQDTEVSYLLLPNLLKRVESLETSTFVTQDQLNDFKDDVRKDIALTISVQPHSREKPSTRGKRDSELNSHSESSPLQLGLVEKSEDKGSELPDSSPSGIQGKDLSKHLGVNPSTISANKNKGPSHFSEWSREKDPDGKSWEYREDDKLYYIVIPV